MVQTLYNSPSTPASPPASDEASLSERLRWIGFQLFSNVFVILLFLTIGTITVVRYYHSRNCSSPDNLHPTVQELRPPNNPSPTPTELPTPSPVPIVFKSPTRPGWRVYVEPRWSEYMLEYPSWCYLGLEGIGGNDIIRCLVDRSGSFSLSTVGGSDAVSSGSEPVITDVTLGDYTWTRATFQKDQIITYQRIRGERGAYVFEAHFRPLTNEAQRLVESIISTFRLNLPQSR